MASSRNARGPLLLIRTDATAEIGAGHLMRCLALAQAWQAGGGEARFVSELTAPLQARLAAERIAFETPVSAAELPRFARESGAQWIIVDGYHFEPTLPAALRQAGLRVLFIDDMGGAAHYEADLILNQNLHASEALYAHRAPDTHLLLGLRYCLLRREFWPWREKAREIAPAARKVLVTMGGGDEFNVTLQVLKSIERCSFNECVVAVGGANPHLAELEKFSAGSGGRFIVKQNISDMAQWMAWADVAIAASGTTSWELAYMGLPAVLIPLYENQRPLAEELGRRGACLFMPADFDAEMLADQFEKFLHDASRREAMSRTERKLVDGAGAERVLAAMRDVESAKSGASGEALRS